MHALVGALKEQAEEAKKPRAKSQSKVKSRTKREE